MHQIKPTLKTYLEFLSEALHVVFVQLHDVFDKLLDGNGLHIICRRKKQELKQSARFYVQPHLTKLARGVKRK